MLKLDGSGGSKADEHACAYPASPCGVVGYSDADDRSVRALAPVRASAGAGPYHPAGVLGKRSWRVAS